MDKEEFEKAFWEIKERAAEYRRMPLIRVTFANGGYTTVSWYYFHDFGSDSDSRFVILTTTPLRIAYDTTVEYVTRVPLDFITKVEPLRYI